jgi:peptide/nickel transport system substrate-binding protein
VVLERNPDYHGPQPKLEQLIFRPVTDPMTRVAELMAGGVDLAVELSPDNVAAFRGREGFAVHEQTGPHLWFVILNTRSGPFRDRRLRRAVNLAVDKRALVRDVLRDTAVVAAGPVPRAFSWAAAPDLAPYPHDPERARDLITAAGVETPLEVRFLVPRGGSGMLAPVQMATAIQADLARVGIRARIETYEWNAYLARVNKGLSEAADMAQMAWMTNDPDTLPFLALRCAASPEAGGFNSGYYCNPEVDELIERARRATDRAERGRLYRQLAHRVHADAPWLVVASWRQNAVTCQRVRGFRLEPSFFLRLAGTWKAP